MTFCWLSCARKNENGKVIEVSIHWMRCVWCGNVYWGNNSKKYCSDQCKEEVFKLKQADKAKGLNTTIDELIARRQTKIEKPIKTKSFDKAALVPVHYSSNGVRWEWRNK